MGSSFTYSSTTRSPNVVNRASSLVAAADFGAATTGVAITATLIPSAVIKRIRAPRAESPEAARGGGRCPAAAGASADCCRPFADSALQDRQRHCAFAQDLVKLFDVELRSERFLGFGAGASPGGVA